MKVSSRGITKYEQLVVDETFKAIEEEIGFDRETVRGRSRKSEVVMSRYVGIYTIKRFTKIGQVGIGNIFDRDHSSVIHALGETSIWLENPHRYMAETIMLKRVINTVASKLDMESGGMSMAKTVI